MLRDVNFQKVVQHTKIQHATCNLLQASYIKGSLFLTILTLSGPIIHLMKLFLPFVLLEHPRATSVMTLGEKIPTLNIGPRYLTYKLKICRTKTEGKRQKAHISFRVEK